MTSKAKKSKADSQDNGDASADKYDLSMFGRIAGIKPDQLYAFRKYSEAQDYQEQTLDQWKKLLQSFGDRII